MERFVQYLDDLEDIIYLIASLAERFRQVLRFAAFVSASVILQALGILLALTSPPLAVAAASLLMVGMLYRAVVHNIPLVAVAS
jgi:hypothetical protein